MSFRTTSIFHYTRERDTLLKILRNGLIPNYCKEEFSNETIAFPMLSFCDIPLSQTGEHTRRYGRYAIGLKKGYAISNGINPILYVHSDALRLVPLYLMYYENRQKELTDKLVNELDQNARNLKKEEIEEKIGICVEGGMLRKFNHILFGYIKPYTGEYQGQKQCNYE